MATEVPVPSSFGDLTSILDLIKQFTGTQGSSNTTTTLGSDASSSLQALLGRLLPSLDSGQFSPDAAVKDSQGLIQDIMKQLQEGTLPQIYNQQNASGGYNSTTGQLLANDAASRAAAQGAAAVSGTKEKYAGIQNQQMQQLMQLVIGLINANKNTNTTTTAGKPAGSPASNLAKAALGAAAANAAKNAAKSKPPGQKPKDDNNNDGGNSDSSAVEKAINDAYKENGGQPAYDQNSGDQITKELLDSLGGNNNTGDTQGGPNDPFASGIPDSPPNSLDGDPLDFSGGLNDPNAQDSPDNSSNMDDLFGDFTQVTPDNTDTTDSTDTPDPIDLNDDNSGDFIIDDGGDDFQ